jgi:hypothetical protein
MHTAFDLAKRATAFLLKDDLTVAEVPKATPEMGLLCTCHQNTEKKFCDCGGVYSKKRVGFETSLGAKKTQNSGLQVYASVKKADDELQIAWGEVYVPNVPDTEGDFMSPIEVRKMAYHFMAKSQMHASDTQHDNKLNGSIVVESFIARAGDPDFIEGAWVVGMHVADPKLWAKVKKGEINGFSLQAEVNFKKTKLTLVIPSSVAGLTGESSGHTHRFSVALDDEGQVIGGSTDFMDGHFHVIKRSTVTEPAGDDGHKHRYAVVNGLTDAQTGAGS